MADGGACAGSARLRGSRERLYDRETAEEFVHRLAWRVIARDRYTIVSHDVAEHYIRHVRHRLLRHFGKLRQRIPWQTAARLQRHAARWCEDDLPFGMDDSQVIAARAYSRFSATILVDGKITQFKLPQGWKHFEPRRVASKMLGLLHKTSEFDVIAAINTYDEAEQADSQARREAAEKGARAKQLVLVQEQELVCGILFPAAAMKWNRTVLHVFTKGFKAHRRGVGLHECPYGFRGHSITRGKQYAAAWRKGWRWSSRNAVSLEQGALSMPAACAAAPLRKRASGRATTVRTKMREIEWLPQLFQHK